MAAGFAVAEAGTDLARAVAVVLPAAFVAACGLWACLLTFRKVHKTSSRTSSRWLRFAPDVMAAATAGGSLLALARHDLLTTQPAAGLLFPPAVWGSVRLWRRMSGSGRLMVKAGADITLSLLLGAELVLLLVWLANLLSLPRPEVTALRAAADRAGSVADLPWWVWTGLYALLAAAGLAFALRPSRLAKVMRWSGRLRVVPVVGVTRRVLTCVHIGLMAVVLVGLAAPGALAATFQRELKAAYTVALQRELRAQAEQAAYTEIRLRFTAATPTATPVLAAIVTKVHDISSPTLGDSGATRTETDLARRLGELQALALALRPPPSLLAAEQSPASRAGFDKPVRDSPDLSGRLGKLDEQDTKDDDASKRAEQAGDLAAAAIASTISIPHISDNEVFQIVREYLSGLIEGSRIKDVFAAWIGHIAGSGTPPDAETMVVPDPARIEHAASAALSGEFTAEGLADPVTDPLATDPALTTALRESPLDAAVDLVNQERYLQENSGPCTGCTRPDNPANHQVEPPEDHVVEP